MRYAALRVIVFLGRFAAVGVQVLFCGQAWEIQQASFAPTTSLSYASVGAIIMGFVAALGIWAAAELITVILDIEDNTRRLADRAERGRTNQAAIVPRSKSMWDD